MEEFTRLNTELQRLQAQMAEKKWVSKRLGGIGSEIEMQEIRVKELQTQLHKEQADVDNLEGLSLVGLFYTFLGSKEQQLEKERQEALRAHLQYEEAHRTLELLNSDYVNLQNRSQILEDVTRTFEAKLETKLSLLLVYGHADAQTLKNLHTQIQNLRQQQQETSEAIEAAKHYQNVLFILIGQLASSKNWGTWDLFGGGIIASYGKQKRLSDARQTASSLKYYGQKLKKELSDLQQSYHLEVNVSDIERFVDIFFDNLWVDWMVQQRISKSLESAKLVRSQLHQLIIDLTEKYTQLNQQINAEEELIKAKIISAEQKE